VASDLTGGSFAPSLILNRTRLGREDSTESKIPACAIQEFVSEKRMNDRTCAAENAVPLKVLWPSQNSA